jgi:hypothetical protein
VGQLLKLWVNWIRLVHRPRRGVGGRRAEGDAEGFVLVVVGQARHVGLHAHSRVSLDWPRGPYRLSSIGCAFGHTPILGLCTHSRASARDWSRGPYWLSTFGAPHHNLGARLGVREHEHLGVVLRHVLQAVAAHKLTHSKANVETRFLLHKVQGG